MSTGTEVNSTALIADRVGLVAGDQPTHIAGYELEERIGVGGFGEVWRAIGPGGLPKAVKILHGRMDGHQAHSELKALERVRGLRHPFLLSIERIEVSDDRLIVVTELADQCLEDRFEEARSQGHKGIPRDELMVYLRDAADALDFMFEQHGLQHLDIKPENLLVQGDHVKVGDFGLAKDIRHTAVSLVGGFTPLYAPPELFEGEPNRTSDQYSLAIVYQVMLTGVPPFAGRTAAQLTAQHLRNTPDLSALQPVDRPVIARALSKNPLARFQNCRQFIDELSKRRNSRVRTTTGGHTAERPTSKTEVVDPANMTAPEDLPALETVPLPPIDPDVTTTSFRPAIFIGTGGLGGRALAVLKTRLCERYGDGPLPAFPLLYVDTDARSITAVRPDTDEPGLTDDETVCIPLRSSREFRGDSEIHLGWISRRWLYNIPRSRQVEGIRPLGRLALVDHQQSVRQRLRDVISRAVTEEAIQQTAEQSGLPVAAGPPDIFVIASTSGGTGSGTVQDLGWLAREICEDLQVEHGQISAVLLHGTGTSRQTSDLQEASTISFLKELQHFSTPGLSGPRGLRSKGTEDETAPFDHTCLVHLGDGLSDGDFCEQVTRLGDYLCLNAVSDQREVLRLWREQSTGDDLPGTTALRTLGMASTDDTSRNQQADSADVLCHRILSEWFADLDDGGDASHSADGLQEIRTLVGKLGLTEEQVSATVVSCLRGETGRRLEAFSQACWDALDSKPGGTGPVPAELFDRIAAPFADVSADDADPFSPRAVIRPQLDALAASRQQAGAAIREHVIALLDQPGRGCTASMAVRQLLDQVNAAAGICERLRDEIEGTSKQLRSLWCSSADAAATPLSPQQLQELKVQSQQYCVLLCSLEVCQQMLEYVAGVRDIVTAISADLVTLRFRVRHLLEEPGQTTADREELPESVVEAFRTHIVAHVRSGPVSLWDGTGEESQLGAVLQRQAVEFLSDGIPGEQPAGTRSGKTLPEAAHPLLTNVGGGRRVLAVLPASASKDRWKSQLVDRFGNCVSLAASADNRVSVYCEVERITFENVLTQFTRLNPRLQEVAARVHSRNDIEW
ncbi:Tubulin-like protein [Maioricimonas rarisocia]|uniref:Tubulin-like protein n=1 Tax=Maioricimonas rarisocia TaxID=2528026 RepID=A0A517Z4W6_9PLAN|nr:tubulin-like doman-containing protein [Maioricimonas rarisocia]QDU37489.1 Tubulin-like protein [Maioricimonas rarisocia]